MPQVVQGFSVANRILIYLSLFLTPAQYITGFEARFPTGAGFLAYNLYNQYVWYTAVRHKQLHALSLLIVDFNMIYAFSYLGGVTHHNPLVSFLLGLGTAGTLILNTVAAWTSWGTNQPEGFGVYQFFFFGWHILTPGWHKFLLVWQIWDTITVIFGIIFAMAVIPSHAGEPEEDPLAIGYGALLSSLLIFGFSSILWVELIVARNHIQSETDMVAVGLFIAQVVFLVLPGGFTKFVQHFFTSKSSTEDPEVARQANDVPLDFYRKELIQIRTIL